MIELEKALTYASIHTNKFVFHSNLEEKGKRKIQLKYLIPDIKCVSDLIIQPYDTCLPGFDSIVSY